MTGHAITASGNSSVRSEPRDGGNDSLNELKARLDRLESKIDTVSEKLPEDRMSLVVFSGELDRLLAALVIANGAAACGKKVAIFFTFWATPALKQPGRHPAGKRLVERVFGWMLPGGWRRRKLSHMDWLGAGRWMMRREMERKGIADLPELIRTAGALGVEIHVCEMSMDLMGISSKELMDYPHLSVCGVSRFVQEASRSRATLFI